MVDPYVKHLDDYPQLLSVATDLLQYALLGIYILCVVAKDVGDVRTEKTLPVSRVKGFESSLYDVLKREPTTLPSTHDSTPL
jgi:hypothetical protein